MKKQLLLLLPAFILTVGTVQGQLKVGDNPNTISPSAILEVESTTQGLLTPRMTTTQRTAITSPADGLQVYDITSQTIWYWNNTTWVEIKPGSGVDTTNDGWANNTVNARTELSTLSSGAARATSAAFGIKDNGLTSIGTSTPDSSSFLDISSSNKGILIPRVNLSSSTQDIDTIAGQATGLLIFNNGTAFAKGFYFWNGTEWRSVNNASAEIATIATLGCSSATLFPKTYTAGTPYTGTMSIPYTVGNGAAYNAGTPIASTGVTGLTATLQSGTLTSGSGNLVYTVTGTPSASSPSTASFALPTTMSATGCTAVVGIGNQFTIGQVQSSRIPINAATFFANGVTTPHMTGKASTNTGTVDERPAYDYVADTIKAKYVTINGLRLDFLESEASNNVRPVFYNTTNAPITYTISTISTANSSVDGAATTIAPHYYSYQIDGNDDMALDATNYAEYINVMLSFTTGQWYNVTFYATRDATNVYLYMSAQRLN